MESDMKTSYFCLILVILPTLTSGLNFSGIEKVDYICVRDGDGQTMADTLCSGLKKPLAWNKRCSLPSCHYWNATYGPCNAQCGDGMYYSNNQRTQNTRISGFVLLKH